MEKNMLVEKLLDLKTRDGIYISKSEIPFDSLISILQSTPSMPSVERIKEVIDTITEGRLKDLTVYRPSFVGSSKKPMLDELAQIIHDLKGEE